MLAQDRFGCVRVDRQLDLVLHRSRDRLQTAGAGQGLFVGESRLATDSPPDRELPAPTTRFRPTSNNSLRPRLSAEIEGDFLPVEGLVSDLLELDQHARHPPRAEAKAKRFKGFCQRGARARRLDRGPAIWNDHGSRQPPPTAMSQPPEQPPDGTRRRVPPTVGEPRSLYRRLRRWIASPISRPAAALPALRGGAVRRPGPLPPLAGVAPEPAPPPLVGHASAGWGGPPAPCAVAAREPRLTVAVDITPFWEPLTGIGWYLYLLLRHLADSDEVRIRLYGPTVVATAERAAPVVELPRGRALEEVVYEVPENLVLSAGLLMRWLRRAERLLIAADGNEVVFAPNFRPPRRLGLARGRPGGHGPRPRVPPSALDAAREDPRQLAGEPRRDHAASRPADHRQRRGARRAGGVRLRRARSGARRAPRRRPARGPGRRRRRPAGLPERYGLHVGTLEPRKNILRPARGLASCSES